MFETLINIIESLIIMWFTFFLLSKKTSRINGVIWTILFSIIYCFYMSFINLFSVSESFLTFLNYALVFVFACIVSDDSLSYKLFVSTLALNIIGIENTVQNMTLSYLLFGKVDYYLLMGSLRIPNVIVSQIAHIVLFYFAYKAVLKMKSYVSDKDFYIVTLLSMLCNYLSISFESVAIRSEHYEFLMILGIYETVAFVIIMIFLFKSIYSHSQNESNQQLKLEIYKNQINTNNKMLSTQKELYQLRHDMKHFIQALKDNDFKDSQEKVGQVIEKYDKSIAESPLPIQTSSPAINYVLNIKREEASIKGISFVSKINIPHAVKIDDSDLYLLLANILDNAIVHIGMEKKILVEMNDVNDMFMIRVTNSVDEQLLNERHNFIKLKMESEHGFGLKTIEEITENYDGFVSYNQSGWELIVTVLFPLNRIN